MNYLKKKIKTVVHGNNHKHKDDDDDFDNYVPEVPPHPSTLAENEIKFDSNNNNFANFDSIASSSSLSLPSVNKGPLTNNQLPTLGTEESLSETPIPKLSLEELKAREEEHKKIEKEKLRQQEESKKDREDWQFFLSLTAKVEAVTSKTQTVLEKLQTESAVKDIIKVEDPLFSDKYDETAPKTSGAWTAFEETEEHNPSDPIFTFPKEEETTQQEVGIEKIEPVIDKETQRIARELINDFGFTNPAPGIPLAEGDTNIEIEENSIDPFDTSFIDVEAIKSGEFILKPTLIKDIEVGEIDPFDTSYIESTIKQDLVIKD